MIESKQRYLLQLVIAILGAFAILYGLRMFNQHLLPGFPLPVRAVLMIVTQWTLLLVPGILMLINREKVSDLGLTRERIPDQILRGLLLDLWMSEILTVLPILAGFKDMVGDTHYKNAWSLPTNSAIAFWEWRCSRTPGSC